MFCRILPIVARASRIWEVHRSPGRANRCISCLERHIGRTPSHRPIALAANAGGRLIPSPIIMTLASSREALNGPRPYSSGSALTYGDAKPFCR